MFHQRTQQSMEVAILRSFRKVVWLEARAFYGNYSNWEYLRGYMDALHGCFPFGDRIYHRMESYKEYVHLKVEYS